MNMMIKKCTAVIAGLTLIFIIAYSVKNTFAQSFFTPNASKPAVDQTAAPVQQTLAPDEFRSTVNSLGQQNLNKLSDQVNKQLPKPSPVVKSILAPGGEMSKPPEAAASPPTPAPPPVTTIPPAAAAPPSSTTPASPPPLPAAEPSMPQPAAAPPVQNQEIYTGFGGGSSTTGTPANNPSNKDSGWDVKY